MNGQTQTPILVHTPPQMEGELTGNAKAGDKIRVRGVRARSADVFAAVAVTGESGRQIIDQGPGHDRKHPKIDHQKMRLEGTVRLSLFGPKGELRGALLADGIIIRIGPKEAEHLAELHAGHQDRCERRRHRNPTQSRRPSERNRQRNGQPSPHQGTEAQGQARVQARPRGAYLRQSASAGEEEGN